MRDGTILPVHLGTKYHIADMLTRALPKVHHFHLLQQYGVVDMFCYEGVHPSSRTEDEERIDDGEC